MQENYDEALVQLNTVLDFVRFGMTQFNTNGLCFGHGTDNGWDEALTLVKDVLHIPFDFERVDILQAKLTDNEKKHIIALFKQRIEAHIPVPYLTNKAYFCGLMFYVDERVLIPRSPIAELIEQQFSPYVEAKKVHNILDMCTGSACIAIALSYAFPEAHVDAVDISEEALVVAHMNVAQHEDAASVTLWQSDLFDALPKHQRYNIIVANPPYVSDEQMTMLPEEYHKEPAIALEAQDDGLAIVDKILKKAANYLTDKGICVIEVGDNQLVLAERYPKVPFKWLQFSRGGEGVFLLTRDQLLTHFGQPS